MVSKTKEIKELLMNTKVNSVSYAEDIWNRDRQNFNACFNKLQEEGLFIENKITESSEIDKDIYCTTVTSPYDPENPKKAIFYKTKLGVFGVILHAIDNRGLMDEHDNVWCVDFPKGNSASLFMSQLNILDSLGELTLNFLIGNHIPEPGSIVPIKNIIDHANEFLARKLH
jgi:hypothetical protein